jgi:hypothetical protein
LYQPDGLVFALAGSAAAAVRPAAAAAASTRPAVLDRMRMNLIPLKGHW